MKSEKPGKYLHFITSFRGFAVLSIVIGHAVAIAYLTFFHKHNSSDPILIANEILFDACTLYFTLISGILFSTVLKEKGYLKFYRNKFLYIFLPYVFYTFIFLLFKIRWSSSIKINTDFAQYFFEKFSKDLIYGEGNFVLWYIPLFLCLCAVTPILDFLLHKNKFTRIVFFILILAPLVISRVETSATYTFRPVNIIYFSGAYALGMYWGINIEEKMHVLKKYTYYILSTAVLTSMILLYCYINRINRMDHIFIQESLFYIQKICLAAVVLVILKKRGEKQPASLKLIATYAMPIYFMHGLALILLAPVVIHSTGQEAATAINVCSLSLLLSVLVVAFPIAIAALVKKAIGQSARMFIGA